MIPTPNRYRTALHNSDLSDGPLTKRQRAIADAVRGCHDLADFTAAPRETVTTIHVATIQLGFAPEIASNLVREGINRARNELDRMEGVLNAYGAEAFSPIPQAVPAAGLQAETRHGVVVNLLRRLAADERVLLKAGDSKISIAPDGGFFIAQTEG